MEKHINKMKDFVDSHHKASKIIMTKLLKTKMETRCENKHAT